MNKFLITLTPREKKLLLLAGGLLLIVVSLKFFVLPTYDNYQAAKDDLAVKKAQLVKLTNYKKTCDKDGSKQTEYEEKLVALDKRLPNSNEIAETLYFIKVAVSDNKINLVSFEATSDESSTSKQKKNKADALQEQLKGVNELSVTILVSGKYDGIKDYIKSLYEGSENRSFNVKSFEITRDDSTEENKDTLEAEIKITAYVLDQQRVYSNDKIPMAETYNSDEPFTKVN